MNHPVKIALFGDSIRLLGYGTALADLLGDGYEIVQSEENGRFAKYTLRQVFEMRDAVKDADVIHWNNGLWDVYDMYGDGELFSSIDEYEDAVLRLAKRLLAITPNVIFATTTPVRAGHPHVKNEDIARFNARVVPKLCAMGVIINDLHALVSSDVDAYILESDRIHLSERGVHACAEQIASLIRPLAR